MAPRHRRTQDKSRKLEVVRLALRTCIMLSFSWVLGLLGCTEVPEGEPAKGLYEEISPYGPGFGETEPPAASTAARDSDDEGAADTPSVPAPSEMPVPTQDPTSGPPAGGQAGEETENKYCGDGVCGEGELESCWIDCTSPPSGAGDSPEDATSGEEPAPSEPASPGGSEPESESLGGPWACVAAQCTFEWNMCMEDPTCTGLHECMFGCLGDEVCKDQCLSNAGPLATLLLDDVALCAAAMGCI